MTKELEIEFKNLLTQEEYTNLLQAFGFTMQDAITQENHYFDTADFKLRAQRSALRIRQKETGYECTLKTPAPDGHYEITDPLDANQVEDVFENRSFPAPEVAAVLMDMGIPLDTLQLLGSLKTHRIEFPYNQGLLVLDHSQYHGIEDFEVEYEVDDYEEGKQRFYAFLKSHGIPVREADKKIARFMKATKN